MILIVLWQVISKMRVLTTEDSNNVVTSSLLQYWLLSKAMVLGESKDP